MKKIKLASAIIASMVLFSGAYANNINNLCKNQNMQNNCNQNMQIKQKNMQNNTKCSFNQKQNFKKHTKFHKKPSNINKLFFLLDLSAQQKQDIKNILKEQRVKNQNLNSAFSKTSFDKEKFIQISKNKRENMIQSRADTIEKMYNILNENQKEKLKLLIDLKTLKGKM